MTPAELVAVFEEAAPARVPRAGPVREQIDHATAFAALLEIEAIGPADFLDLGSGGGVPGLVLAARWPENRAVLLDASERRTAFLRRAVAALGWAARVTVAAGRGEALARDPGLRVAFPLVVARSFGSPAVTAEIGGAFLSVGGWLAVSEPGRGEDRWPTAALAELGLAPATIRVGTGVRVALIRRVSAVAERWPRGIGTPRKRPLW